jgi:hypothetical protein
VPLVATLGLPVPLLTKRMFLAEPTGVKAANVVCTAVAGAVAKQAAMMTPAPKHVLKLNIVLSPALLPVPDAQGFANRIASGVPDCGASKGH